MSDAAPGTDPFYGARRSTESLRGRFRSGDVPVAVYGLGHSGVPTAVALADSSGSVVGVDDDEGVVAALNDGDCPVTGEPGLQAAVVRQVEAGRLRATTDWTGAARNARLHVLAVPTVRGGDAVDLAPLDAAVETVGAGLEPGDLVVVESTVPPGTCRDRVRPALERTSGLTVGEFGLACCPRSTTSGRALAAIRGGSPTVVGGADAESASVARSVYRQVTAGPVGVVGDCTTAECVALFESVYRDVTAALGTELGSLAADLGIDVGAAIEATNAALDCDIGSPGLGTEGLSPVARHVLTAGFDATTPLADAARAVNANVPTALVDRTADCLATTGRRLASSSVLVLGFAYQPHADGTAPPPGVEVVGLLADRAADVAACDPGRDASPPAGASDVERPALSGLDPDAVVVTSPDRSLDRVDWTAFGDAVVVDGYGTLTDLPVDHYCTLGRGHC